MPPGVTLVLGIHDRLIVVAINVAPPCLSVPKESDRRKLFQHSVKALQSEVVHLVLKVKQDWNVEFLGRSQRS